MDVKEKLVELSDIQVLQREIECVKRKSYTNCTDCFNCDLLMTDERILSAYANAIDALQNANGVTVQEWISVKDRLPRNYTPVLAYIPSLAQTMQQTVHECHIGADGEWHSSTAPAYREGVTHWMPMPQPPKGE